MATDNTPAPGSTEAVEAGCWCPQFKNDFGLAEPPEGWHIERRCPLHDRLPAVVSGAAGGGFDGGRDIVEVGI